MEGIWIPGCCDNAELTNFRADLPGEFLLENKLFSFKLTEEFVTCKMR